jgi:hypothetical protein
VRYLELFRGAPGLLRLTSFALLGRTPSGMLGVATLLLIERESGSYAVAGLAAALFAGGAAVGGVAYARLIRRLGYGIPLAVGGLISGGALALFPLIARSAPPPVYMPVMAAAGLSFPPLAACVRAQWNRRYDGDRERLIRAATFESVMGEVAFLVGPAIVAAAVWTGSEAVPFPIAGAMIGVACIGFGRHAVGPAPHEELRAITTGATIWGVRFTLTLAAGTLWCVSFGAMTVGIVAATGEAGRQELSGLLVALVSLGAILGGLSFGARDWRVDPGTLLVAVLAAYAGCLAPLMVAQDTAVAFVLMLVFAGTTSAVVLACLNLRIIVGVAPVREVEAFGWLNAFTVAGLAIGPAVGGQVADRLGSGGAFAAASALAAAGALVAFAGRSG